MNYIDIAFIAFTLIIMFAGAVNGFLVSLISTARVLLVIPVSYFASTYISIPLRRIIAESVPDLFLQIISFIICYILLNIVIGIVISLLKKLQHKEHMPLKHTNAFLGAVFGLLKSAIVICVLSVIFINVKAFIPDDNAFYSIIDGSYTVRFINDIFTPMLEKGELLWMN